MPPFLRAVCALCGSMLRVASLRCRRGRHAVVLYDHDRQRRQWTRGRRGDAGALRTRAGAVGRSVACLAHELRGRELRVQTRLPLPITYRGVRIELGYRIDLLVEDAVVVELKAVAKLLPIHKDGIKRLVNHL